MKTLVEICPIIAVAVVLLTFIVVSTPREASAQLMQQQVQVGLPVGYGLDLNGDGISERLLPAVILEPVAGVPGQWVCVTFDVVAGVVQADHQPGFLGPYGKGGHFWLLR